MYVIEILSIARVVIEAGCLVIIVNITVEIVFWVLIKEHIMKVVIVFVNNNYLYFTDVTISLAMMLKENL